MRWACKEPIACKAMKSSPDELPRAFALTSRVCSAISARSVSSCRTHAAAASAARKASDGSDCVAAALASVPSRAVVLLARAVAWSASGILSAAVDALRPELVKLVSLAVKAFGPQRRRSCLTMSLTWKRELPYRASKRLLKICCVIRRSLTRRQPAIESRFVEPSHCARSAACIGRSLLAARSVLFVSTYQPRKIQHRAQSGYYLRLGEAELSAHAEAKPIWRSVRAFLSPAKRRAV